MRTITLAVCGLITLAGSSGCRQDVEPDKDNSKESLHDITPPSAPAVREEEPAPAPAPGTTTAPAPGTATPPPSPATGAGASDRDAGTGRVPPPAGGTRP